MKLLILFAVVVSASAKVAPPKCHVSAWGEWSEWNAPNHDNSIKSHKLTEKPHNDGSRRATMMRLMQEQADIYAKCMSEGTCPEYENQGIDTFAPCSGGLARTSTASFPCELIDHLSFVPIADLYPDPTVGGTPQTNDIWGWVDPLSQDEYAIVGMTDGTSFVRVTDGENPVVLGHLKTNAGLASTTWRDVKVYNDHAFIVSEHEGHGMQVFDLTRLRTLDGINKERFEADAVYSGTGNSHNIVGSLQGFMYLVGSTFGDYVNNCDGGLHVIDVRDPKNPTFAGCFGGDSYVHDAQCLVYTGPDTRYQGREVCYCYNEDSLTIVDVEDKSNMKLISRVTYDGFQYTHQGWVNDDQTVLLLDDELDEYYGTVEEEREQRSYIWDITDLENPILKNTYFSQMKSIDHNMYAFGQMVYQANYRTGLRILYLDPEAFTLTELANFDVFPNGDGAIFNGAWSNYRFSPDKIVVTSIEYGLFVLQPDVEAINAKITELEQQKTLVRTRSRDILEADDAAFCPSLVETQTM